MSISDVTGEITVPRVVMAICFIITSLFFYDAYKELKWVAKELSQNKVEIIELKNEIKNEMNIKIITRQEVEEIVHTSLLKYERERDRVLEQRYEKINKSKN